MIEIVRGIHGFENTSTGLIVAILIVAALLVICAIVSVIVSIWLAIQYVRYNRTANSCGMTGEQVARRILDSNGLEHIKVKVTGSLLFGNSYSHYFKKVRLRRRTYKKQSVTSLAMAAQKSSLAILDKEGDRDMKSRIRLTPVITFGPLAFVPMVVIGVVLDILIFKSIGVSTIILTALGLAFYVFSFILSLRVLKTEVKAQNRAIEIVQKEGLANGEEVEMMQKLFRLYNIEYVNDMVMAFLEMVYRILMILAQGQGGGNFSSGNSNSR
ncbi:MAG: zinc metallopeptidase [Clostridia bacterium]|nr:zinc metallopeptidase [Clostridia bacterium]